MFTAEQKAVFDTLYGQACKLHEGDQLVTLTFQMLDMLRSVGWSYQARLHSKHVGIHGSNRGGKRMAHASCHRKGHKILRVGFRLQLCGPDRAICFENNPHLNDVVDHTMSLTASEYFGNYVPSHIRTGSVGCSHLNQWLAAIHDGAKTPYAVDMSDPGSDRISKSRVIGNNENLRTAVDEGIVWTVVKFAVAVDYPQLPGLIQRCLNTEHHVGEGDTYKQQ